LAAARARAGARGRSAVLAVRRAGGRRSCLILASIAPASPPRLPRTDRVRELCARCASPPPPPPLPCRPVGTQPEGLELPTHRPRTCTLGRHKRAARRGREGLDPGPLLGTLASPAGVSWAFDTPSLAHAVCTDQNAFRFFNRSRLRRFLSWCFFIFFLRFLSVLSRCIGSFTDGKASHADAAGTAAPSSDRRLRGATASACLATVASIERQGVQTGAE